MVTYWGKNGTRTRVVENILKPDGNRISAQVDYEYDDLYRLVHEHRIAYNGSDPGVPYEYNFAYDNAGNRTSWQTVGGSTINYTYDVANKMTAPGTFTYDDKGNTLTHTVSSITTTYTWDYLNRMTQWQKTGETTQSYVYNGDGLRVRVTPSGGMATDFLLDRREIAEEVMGTTVTAYVGRGVTSRISGAVQMIYHADGLGSTRAMSDSSEVIAQAGIYDAYGNLGADYPTSSAPNFGYAGQLLYNTDSTSLQYLKARYYDATGGRFVSRDPVGYSGGINLYVYASANPVNIVDPWGLWGWGIGGEVGGGFWGGGSGNCSYIRCKDDNGCWTSATVCSACAGFTTPGPSGSAGGIISSCKDVNDFKGWGGSVGGGFWGGIDISFPPLSARIGIVFPPGVSAMGCYSWVLGRKVLN